MLMTATCTSQSKDSLGEGINIVINFSSDLEHPSPKVSFLYYLLSGVHDKRDASTLIMYSYPYRIAIGSCSYSLACRLVKKLVVDWQTADCSIPTSACVLAFGRTLVCNLVHTFTYAYITITCNYIYYSV